MHETMMEESQRKANWPLTETAVLCGSLASLCYSWQGIVTLTQWPKLMPQLVLGLLIIPAFLGHAFLLMAPGALLHPSSLRFFGLSCGTLIGSFAFFCPEIVTGAIWHINYLGGPPPPWPYFATFGIPTLVVAGGCLYLGTLLFSGVPGRWSVKLLSPAVACLAVAGLAVLLWRVFPKEELVLLHRWEYFTILVAGPMLGAITWFPFDYVQNRAIAQHYASQDGESADAISPPVS